MNLKFISFTRNSNSGKWQHYSESLILAMCILTLACAPFFNNLSMKLFTLTSILSLVTFVFSIKKRNYSFYNLALPLSILLLGIINILWYKAFKTDGSAFRETYHSYQNMGKVFIYGFFPTLLMSTSTTTKLNKYLYAAIYLLTFIILTSALYLKFSSKIIRLDFGIGSATGAAYTILLIGFISGTAILCTNKKNLILYILNTASVFTLILFTETRSAILVFPVISIITIAYTYGATRKELLTSTGIFIILIALVLMTFKDQITHRYEVALNDIQQYKNSNSWTSLGARLAMYEVGLKSFQNSPLIWKSAESRAENIRKYARENKIYNGALPFLNIHLHNEIIESASIKGIAGILSTMIFYLSLCILAFRRKSILLAGLLIAIVSLGLSDVLLWARSIPIIIIMTIVIAIAIESHKKISSL